MSIITSLPLLIERIELGSRSPHIRLKGSDKKPFILILNWVLVNATLIIRMNLPPNTSFCEEKRQNLNQIYQRNLFSLFDTSFISRMVESKTVKGIFKQGFIQALTDLCLP